jgi:purine-binding chemotaxis protein CheW
MALTLLFKLADENYGLEIDAIQEIIEDPELYYTPLAEGVLKGAINFHGQILAVIDLPALLGFNDARRDHRHIVLSPSGSSMVLIVSSVERIVNLDLSGLEPPTETKPKALRGVAWFEEMPINLLDTDDIVQKLKETFAE